MKTARLTRHFAPVAAALCLLAFLSPLSAWSQKDPAGTSGELQPKPAHSGITEEIHKRLTRVHYNAVTLNDEVSGRIFDSYIKVLDPARRYFLNADIQEFEPLRTQFDDMIEEGDIAAAFDIFNRYKKRRGDYLRDLVGMLKDGFDRLDFHKEEYLERTHTTWAGSAAELRERWRRQLKGDVLNRMLAGAERDEIRKALRQRYEYQLKRLGQQTNDDVFTVFTNAYLRAIDPHTAYYSRHQSENFNIHMSLSLEGIGAVLQDDAGTVKVVRLVAGGPADKAGELRAGDRIVGVAQGEDGQMVDILGMRLDKVVTLIRGPKETTVRLEIIPQTSTNEQHKVIRIVRNKVDLADQEAKSQVMEVEVGERTEKIGVIRLPTFYADFAAQRARKADYKHTTRDVKRLIAELQDDRVRGVVVDLRSNGGGSLKEAIQLVGLFIRTGPVVQIRDGRGVIRVRSDTDPDILYDGPLVVLVNRLSASASEIFAGAVQDYGRGMVLGVQTFGKGTVQTVMPISEGHLKLTQAKFYRISGESTQHRGVIPDIEFPGIVDKTEVGESALEHALTWDVIDRARYTEVGDTAPFREELQRRHLKRTQADPDFAHLMARIERLRKERAETTVSLKEETRRTRKKNDEVAELESENARRAAKGEKPFASFAELVDYNEKQADSDDLPEEDPILEEAVHVLADFIDLSQPAAPAPRRGT